MTDEKKEDITDSDVEGKTEEKATGLTAEEQRAYDKGWRPESDYEGDDWIDAKEFNGRAPLYDGLSKQSKRIKALEGVVETLAAQAKKADSVALKKAKAQLKAERVKAHEEEDYDKVVELEDKARELDEAEKAEANTVVEIPEFVAWREENEWYGRNEKASLLADAYAAQLNNTNHGLDATAFYQKVTKYVQEAMPNEFSGKLPNRGNAPGNQGKGRSSKKGASFSQLTSDQKAVCRELVNKGLFTEDEYIKQLDELGEIDKG